jgi:AraC-like DNA-binding protein
VAPVRTPAGTRDRDWADLLSGNGATRLIDSWANAALAAVNGVSCLEPIHNTPLMHAIKRELEAQYTEPVRIADLAARHHLDTHYLIRGFRRNFGFTPLAYVQFLRREHFLWELMRPDRRHLLELAVEAGFGDYATFCRKLRGLCGRPPSQLLSAVGG